MIASQDTVTDSARLAALIASWNATVMQATPATWQMLLDAGWTGKRDMKVLCGGEALSVELAAQLVSRCATVWNMYGPTETTIWSTTGQVRAGDAGLDSDDRSRTPRVYVLDSAASNSADWRERGDLYRRRWPCARLSRTPGSHRRTIRAPSLQPRAGPSTLSHRRSRTPSRRWLARVPRSRRSSDQAARLSHRPERDRSSHAPNAPAGARRGRGGREDRRGDKTLVAYVVGDPSSDVSLREQLAATLPGTWFRPPSSFCRRSR